MAPRYAEGYTKGVHDEDALKLLSAILPVHRTLGLLRFGPRVRALALLFREIHRSTDQGLHMEPLIAAHGAMRRTFGAPSADAHPLRMALEKALIDFTARSNAAAMLVAMGDSDPRGDGRRGGALFFEQLATGGAIAASAEAAAWTADFKLALTTRSAASRICEIPGSTRRRSGTPVPRACRLDERPSSLQ